MAAEITNDARKPYDAEVAIDEEGYRDWTLRWQVRTLVDESALVAFTAPGMPVPGSAYSRDVWCIFQGKGSAKLLKREGSKQTWDVTTIFTNRPCKRDNSNSRQDPLAEPPVWSGGNNKFQEEIRKDKDGVPMLNSALEPITGIQRDKSRPTISLQMNVAWLNLAFLSGYIDAVNDATFWGVAARKLKCDSFTWQKHYAQTGYPYYTVTFTFEINDLTWDISVLDHGFMRLVAGSNPPRFERAKDGGENPIHVLLDNNGNATQVPTLRQPAFRVYPEKPFSSVGWPVIGP